MQRYLPIFTVTLFLACLVLLSSNCRSQKTLRGRVIDYNTKQPLAGATVSANQRGWGLSENTGEVIWDKDYVSTTTTDDEGKFLLNYRVGTSAYLSVSRKHYERFLHWYAPSSTLKISLKPSNPHYKPLPDGFLHFGLRKTGEFYGWDFSTAKDTTDRSQADIFPTFVSPKRQGKIILRTFARGGILFIPSESLEVDGDFLVFSDEAPLTGYKEFIELDFKSKGGIVFVRTRDGNHYAKFSFTPSGYSAGSYAHDVRGVGFRYIYNPHEHDRNLEFQHTLPRR